MKAQWVFIATHKNEITVIVAKTKVVFKSLCIGLKYSKIVGEIEAQTQSISNQNKLPKNIIVNIQTTSGKYFLATFLSQKAHLK